MSVLVASVAGGASCTSCKWPPSSKLVKLAVSKHWSYNRNKILAREKIGTEKESATSTYIVHEGDTETERNGFFTHNFTRARIAWLPTRVSHIMPALNLALNADFEKKH